MFAAGYRPDYQRWVGFPGAVDDLGFPIQKDGSSTVIAGLHFMGVPFQRKRKSATLLGVAEDAAVLAETIVAKRAKRSAPRRRRRNRGTPGEREPPSLAFHEFRE